MLLYAALYMSGVDGLKPIVSAPVATSAAAVAGLVERDEIVAVDDRALESWQELRWRMLRLSGAPSVELTVKRDGETSRKTIVLDQLTSSDWEGPFLDTLGLRVYLPSAPPAVMRVVEDRAGAIAGR